MWSNLPPVGEVKVVDLEREKGVIPLKVPRFVAEHVVGRLVQRAPWVAGQAHPHAVPEHVEVDLLALACRRDERSGCGARWQAKVGEGSTMLRGWSIALGWVPKFHEVHHKAAKSCAGSGFARNPPTKILTNDLFPWP